MLRKTRKTAETATSPHFIHGETNRVRVLDKAGLVEEAKRIAALEHDVAGLSRRVVLTLAKDVLMRESMRLDRVWPGSPMTEHFRIVAEQMGELV